MDEKPLWVQLYWGKDQREGRFVLQNAKLPKVRRKTFVNEHCRMFRFRSQSAVVSKNVVHRNVNPRKKRNKTKYVVIISLIFVRI